MPKRKSSGSRKQRSKRLRTSGPSQCPQLPQEIWDKIIGLSMDIDIILGVIPSEAHRYFQNPFMRVNQACRQGAIRLIASSTWIELRSLDHRHALLVHELAKQSPAIDEFWFPVLFSAGRVPRVVFEFGREIHQRSTRLHVNDTRTFLSPYSFATLVWLTSKIGPVLDIVNCIVISGKELAAASAREIEPVVAFLEPDRVLPPEKKLHEFRFTFSGRAPITLDSLWSFPSRICRMAEDVGQDEEAVPDARSKVILLYMMQYLARDAESILRPPNFWAHTVLGTPGGRARTFATKRVRFARAFFKMEMAACDAFRDLLKTDLDWVWHHAENLTKGYNRWITEPRFTYYGAISDDELSTYYRKIGYMVGLYDAMNKWLQEPIHTVSPICKMFQRKTTAFMCASKMNPDNTAWRDDFQKAKAELIHYFPRHGWRQIYDECCFYYYTDVDEEERVWIVNGVCPWARNSLPYLHRARRLISDDSEDSEWSQGSDSLDDEDDDEEDEDDEIDEDEEEFW